MISNRKIEYGDFQTPMELCLAITAFLGDNGVLPDVVVEPTCGQGSFVKASMDCFPAARLIYGFDVHSEYVDELRDGLRKENGQRCRIEQRDFFHVNWADFFARVEGNLLVIGNPPWVTNAALGALESQNLPQKTNFQGLNGFAAKTGKANFDISEWMLIKILEALNRKKACLALLCKTSTARKTLRHAWINHLNIGRASLHLIDAQKHFGVSVDACLLVIHTGLSEEAHVASVYPGLSFENKTFSIGLAGRDLVADIDEYLRLQDIDGIAYYAWRSGVKHDACAVMEFIKKPSAFVNGLGEEGPLETTFMFPLLKSSDIANGRLVPRRWVLLTQRKTSDDTKKIETIAPRTWQYLVDHAALLDKRRSIIYQKRARFAVFGVGEYVFSPWKVAISGLYKNIRFQVIGQFHGKPVVLDDTCYFISCDSEREARLICELLNSDTCQRFLRSLVFLDAKRPITIDVLNRIDLKRLAERLNKEKEARECLSRTRIPAGQQQMLVSEEKRAYGAKTSRRNRPSRRT